MDPGSASCRIVLVETVGAEEGCPHGRTAEDTGGPWKQRAVGGVSACHDGDRGPRPTGRRAGGPGIHKHKGEAVV